MAEGRMLKKRISKSQKFAALKNDKARVLYLLLLPHVDVNGRFEADLNVIKGSVCPYVESLTIKSIGACLRKLHEVGLVFVYEIAGEKYLQVYRFHDFNRVDPKKETNPHIPEPTPAQLQRSAIVTPAEVKLSKVKVKESISKDKYMDFVFLSLEEHKKLIAQFGEKVTNEKLQSLNDYIGSKGVAYKSHYHTILSWSRKDDPKNPEQPKIKTCFHCRAVATKIFDNKGGKLNMCDECHGRLLAAPAFKTHQGKVIKKWALDKGQLESMIEKQKAKR